jgi:hypothetical protein
MTRLHLVGPPWRPNIFAYVPERAFKGVMRVTLHAG